MIQQELMTTKEVAAYLRIKERKVYELISARRIPCIRVAGKWLFPKVLIDLWVVQNSEGSSNPTPPSTVHPWWVAATIHCLNGAYGNRAVSLPLMFNGSLDGLHRLPATVLSAGCMSLIQTRLIITGPLSGAPWLTSTWCLSSGPGANRV